MVNNKLKADATKKIIDNIRDLYTAKITLHLGNPNLKLVHTNQFLFTELPTDVFKLTNLKVIADALNSSYSRYSGYEVNRWYIENSTITNDGKSAKMELDVNPFASNIIKFQDDLKSFENAFTDAVEAKKQSQESKKKKVKSVPEKTDINKAIDDVGKKFHGYGYSHCCSTLAGIRANKRGDCWAMSFLLACELKKRGVTARILNYPTSMSANHRSVQYKDSKGKWQNFPYRKYGFHSWFNNTGGVSKGRNISLGC